jgi:hypothetical protein
LAIALGVDEVFDLEFTPADSSGLVPMYLSVGRGAILEANPRYTFAFSPPAAPVRLAQALDLTNSGARGDGLDAPNVAYDLEVHDLSWQETSVWSKEQQGPGGKPPNYQVQRPAIAASARGRASARVLSALGRPRPSTLW